MHIGHGAAKVWAKNASLARSPAVGTSTCRPGLACSVGGFTVPEPAQSAPPIFGPFSLPPSHLMGLPHACQATRLNPSAVTFVAPPFGTCHHGMP
jgi:hypothetical protein